MNIMLIRELRTFAVKKKYNYLKQKHVTDYFKKT